MALGRFLDPEAAMSSPVVAALVILLLVMCAALTYAMGGTGHISQMIYLGPIVLAALRFRHLATLAVAVAAGLLAGPIIPVDLSSGGAPHLSEWLSRCILFVLLGQLAVLLFRAQRAMSSALQSTQRIASQMQELAREAEVQALRKSELTARLDPAIRGTGMRMLFQPIVDLRAGTVSGLEALARFDIPPPQPPDTWFAHAWEVGLGPEMEVLALRHGLSALSRVPESVYLSANVSPRTLMSLAFEALIDELPLDRVVLEVTEHSKVEDYPSLREVLADLRGRGMRLAVDDVGAGFSTLRHVLTLFPDIIKLDVALVRDLEQDPARIAIARGLCACASELGAVVVAEGIESKAGMQALVDLGITHGQGYFLGRPREIERVVLNGIPAPGEAPAAPHLIGLESAPARPTHQGRMISGTPR
jgi:EAL domain-containing protein (putative c-di-GMP-specific phosphodiesterase class I)